MSPEIFAMKKKKVWGKDAEREYPWIGLHLLSGEDSKDLAPLIENLRTARYSFYKNKIDLETGTKALSKILGEETAHKFVEALMKGKTMSVVLKKNADLKYKVTRIKP